MSKNSPLTYKVLAKCSSSKARRGLMMLRQTKPVDTPGEIFIEYTITLQLNLNNLAVFMPVGTQGTLKGVFLEQLKQDNMNCQIMLSNTYHLGMRPGTKILEKAGGLHKFMNW